MKLGKKINSLILALAISVSGYTYSSAQQNIDTHSINVGQGDSTYIELADETHILKDVNEGEWKLVNGDWYYYVNGFKKTGWVKDLGRWYYLNNNGVMQKGWIKDNGIWYYLRPSGAMATGWEEVNGIWYYLRPSGAMATGWEEVNGNWYYLRPSGAMATGWEEVNGNWYYMYSSGIMATNTTIDGWRIDENGIATPLLNDNNTNNNDDGYEDIVIQGNVYITPSGKSYHSTKKCTTLKRSTTILEVTKSEAIRRGKSDPCNLCVR